MIALIAVGLVFNASGVKDVLPNLFNRIVVHKGNHDGADAFILRTLENTMKESWWGRGLLHRRF